MTVITIRKWCFLLILILLICNLNSVIGKLEKVYFINSAQYLNNSNCESFLTSCTTVQDALDVFATSLDVIQYMSNATSLSTIQVTFIMLNNEQNFCGYSLTTPINPNIDYYLHFQSYETFPIQLTCQKGFGILNFLETRSDISSLSFKKLWFNGIVFTSCSALSLSISECQIVNGGFFSLQNYEPEGCSEFIVSNITNRSVYISGMSAFNAIIFVGHVTDGLVENVTLDGINGITFADMKSLEVRNLLSRGDGIISTSNVKSVNFYNFISNSPSCLTNIRVFESFRMENSVFDKYTNPTPALNLDRGDSVSIIDTTVKFSSQWLSIKTVKKVSISNLNFYRNYVLALRVGNQVPIFMFSCDNIVIENSNFDGNSGVKSGAIFIDDFINVHIVNNTFKNCRSQNSGGAIFMGNYQQQALLETGLFHIYNNSFINNTCESVGGAISTSSLVSMNMRRNTFIRNHAQSTGGAFSILDHCRNCLILESYFEENGVSGKLVELESILWSQGLYNSLIGSGGAIAIFNDPRFVCLISNSEFVRNYASKGGAILMGGNNPVNYDTTTRSYVKNCKFERNKALKTGNDIYLLNIQVTPELRDFIIDQKPENDNSFSSTPFIFRIETVSTTLIYPGQPITIKFYVENIFGHEVNISSQYVLSEEQSQYFPYLNYSNSDDRSLVLTPYLLDSKLPTNSTFTFTVYSEDKRRSSNFTLSMKPCPHRYVWGKNFINSMVVYQCVQDNSWDLPLVLGITIPISIFVLILGGILGILSVHVIRFMARQIFILKKKQKAEKSLETRIIDKRIVFNTSSQYPSGQYYSNDLTVPLIDNRQHSTTPSFIIPIENIEIIKKLAEGGLGIVYLGKLWEKIDVAIKLLKSNDQDEEFEQEVSLLSSLRHENIVTFYGICVSENAKYMITEFIERGSLDRVLYRSRIGEVKLSLEKKLSILIATARGISYLHGLIPLVVHRDLKPGNILLDEKNEAKICDFGISRTVTNTTVQTEMTTNLGTLIYCPNEIIEGPTSTNKASKQTATKIDIFSFSIIMWEMFFEITPYSPATGKLSPLFSPTVEELEVLNLNSFNIPYFIVKGIRPIIPFRLTDDDQIKEWITKNMTEERNNPNMVSFISQYFTMVQKGWSHDATCRPAITLILQELEQLQDLLSIK